MKFRNRLKYHLVKLIKCSNREAETLCREGNIFVNDIIALDFNLEVSKYDEIKWKDKIVRNGRKLVYLLFHKPYLYECTSNKNIPENIFDILPDKYQDLFTIGRLDKNSEGLILLTNDGSVYAKMADFDNKIEKEYHVFTHSPISQELEQSFTSPFLLGKRWTLPAKFQKISEYEFKLTLTEGINRQIRRICAKNNNKVKRLVRIRFGNYELLNMKCGEYCEIDKF